MLLRMCCCFKYIQSYEDVIEKKQKEIDELKRELNKYKKEIENYKIEVKNLNDELNSYNERVSYDSYSINNQNNRTSEDIEEGYTVFD